MIDLVLLPLRFTKAVLRFCTQGPVVALPPNPAQFAKRAATIDHWPEARA